MPYPAYGRNPQQQSQAESQYPPTFSSATTSSTGGFKHPADDLRAEMGMSRTPSPTPSEAKMMNEPLFSMKQLTNWRFWIRKEWTKYYIIVGIILVLTALISIYDHQIVKALTRPTNWMHSLKYGYLIPIGILFVISFPPLFGHEIVAILCGLTWGLWFGFGIVCAGTFLGEVGNFYAFKMCCRARGEKMERTQIPYACLARCVRTGGFKIALIARFSAIPGHFTTAVFSTCGMNIFVFSIAAILPSRSSSSRCIWALFWSRGTTTTKSKIISDSVLAATFLVTILAMWYIFHQMALMKPLVIYERRKARQGKVVGVNLNCMGIRMIARQLHLQFQLHFVRDGERERRAPAVRLRAAAAAAADGRLGGAEAAYEAAQRGVPQQQQQQQQAQYATATGMQMEADVGRYNPYSPRNEYGPQGEQQTQYQQWDAQGRAVGYTPGPQGAVMYAPQPTRSVAVAVSANYPRVCDGRGGGAACAGEAEVYAHGRAPAQREGTGEEVGWDMGGPGAGMGMGMGMEMRERERERQPTLPQPQRQQTQGPPQRQQTHIPQTQTPPQEYGHLQDPETPTQAQYATYAEPPSAASTTLAYLRSPFEDPAPEGHAPEPSHAGGHGVEPTGASYHTAHGSMSESVSEYSYDYQQQGQNRAFSPAPTYRTNAR
ncbi:hypothetical protein K438DRAFT_1989470 [Mycena galopus ATCC 62051]|nr:hypothetical protein K438DRAFT_1989470 [Mycena galopus ATCC 62051]